MPFLFKDLNAYPGLRAAFGARLFARNVAQEGTPFSAAVDAAGLVTIGKSATSELGLLGSTETLLEGVTHNPWQLACSALGSSGGAAAAVAAGIVPLAHGNDGGGSLRIPASAAGLFALKPSRGRTLGTGPGWSELEAWISDGCISRSVRDSALFLSQVEAPRGPLAPVGHVREPGRRKLRIGCLSTSLTGTEPNGEVRRALESSAALCRELGHDVIVARSPSFDGSALSRGFFTAAGASIAAMIRMLEPMFGRPIGDEDLEPFTLGLVALAREAGAEGLARARNDFEAASHLYLEAQQPFDVLLTPTLALPPWHIGWLSPTLERDELIARTERAVCYTPVQNLTGTPAMSVPLYWSEAGLPIGSQFAAPIGGEGVLLGLAHELEAARPWSDRWAPHSFVQLARA